ncbi:IPT/TIG domain-containing protein [Clostridium sp. UBA1056]|uniref:IPT/TIG domain-containing protein n=1 Tax=unclassified Clostridium TaxID=2614128 RepID=UPI00321807E5
MKKKISGILAIVMLFSLFLNNFGIEAYAATDYVTAAREVNPKVITPDKEVEVNLKVTGTPPVNVVKPNDVVLVLDKSGSMRSDNRFGAMKESAKEFIDLIDFNSHNAGVVDFSSQNVTRTSPITNDATVLKNHIDSITCDGGTQTGYAIREAMKLLESGREEAQPVIVLLTDGQADSKEDALKAAEEAKQAGIVIYTVALLAPGENADTSAPNLLLRDMATTAKHHNFVLGSVGLIDIYRRIVKEIGISSAYDVEIKETVSPQFEIVPGSYENNIPKPKVEGNTLTWNMLELKADTIELKYKVRLKDGEKAGKYNIAESSKITYKDYAGASRSYNIANSLIEVKYHAPIITSVTNEKGQAAGGEKVTIKGEHFRPGATVSFNATKCTDVVVVDSNTITVTTPPGVQGNATITVTNDDLQKATANFAYYAEPVVTSLSPNVGPYVGGTSVFIEGNYFMSGMKVKFGDVYSDSVLYYNKGKVIAKAPAATKEGLVDVTLENPDGTKLVVKDGYTYEPQIIEKLEIYSLSYKSGPQAGGTRLTISGKNIDPAVKVYFGDKEAQIINYYNKGSILVDTPARDVDGLVDVILENPNGEKATLSDAFEYIPHPTPTITSISPASGKIEGGETVIVDGENFPKDVEITFGANRGEVISFSQKQLKVKVPAGNEGIVDVTVTNPTTGKQSVAKDAYEYLPPVILEPKITSISPNSGKIEGGELIYITGENFVNGTNFQVSIGGNKAQLINFYGSTRINVRVPANVNPGKYDVTIINGDGKTITLPEGYEYLTPPTPEPMKITGISSNSGSTAGGEILYITGERFVNGTNFQVKIGENKAQLLNFYGPTRINVRVPANINPGKYDVTIINNNGEEAKLTEAYEYITPPALPLPEITTLSSTSGYETGGDLLYIEGKNFVKGLTVTIGDINAPVDYFYNSTRIRVKVPKGTVGMANVVVTNPDKQSSVDAIKYEYLEVKGEITSLSIVEGLITGGDLVYINGVNFQPGLKVYFGTEEASELVYYSTTRIRVKIPASTIPGNVDVKIINGDGKTIIKTDGYKYLEPLPVPAPVIEKFITSGTAAATSLPKNGLTNLFGSGFAPGIKFDILNSSGDVVYSDLAPIMYYSELRIRLRVPANITPGMYKFVVKNPDGQQSNKLDIEITN